jgi:hypothetical protein
VVVDPKHQIKADLDNRVRRLREQLAKTDDKTEQKAIKASIRQAKANARRLRRTAVW